MGQRKQFLCERIIAILIAVTLGQYYFTSKIVTQRCYFLIYL